MEELVLIQKSELIKLIREAVRDEVAAAIKLVTTKELLTTTEAAVFIQKSGAWVTQQVKTGRLKNYGTDGKGLFHRDELLKTIENPRSPEIAKLIELVHRK